MPSSFFSNQHLFWFLQFLEITKKAIHWNVKFGKWCFLPHSAHPPALVLSRKILDLFFLARPPITLIDLMREKAIVQFLMMGISQKKRDNLPPPNISKSSSTLFFTSSVDSWRAVVVGRRGK